MRSSPRSALALAALATVALPGVQVVATKPAPRPGLDFDVAGFMDADRRRWMVRAPRHDAAGAAMEGEVALLEGLADAVDDGLLPFDVPRPAGFATLDEGGRAMVYPEIVGRSLDPAALRPGSPLLASLARAVAALHDLPGGVVRAAGLPDYDAESYRARRLAELDRAATSGHLPAALHRRWEHALEDVRLWRFAATPVHGDLATGHVVIADDAVAGVLDWAEARVADPADDVAWLLAEAPEECTEEILAIYTQARSGVVDEHLADRAALAGELAVVRWLMHGVQARSDQVIDDAVHMLGELDEMLADAQPIGWVEPVVEAPDPSADDDTFDGGADEDEVVDGSDEDAPDEDAAEEDAAQVASDDDLQPVDPEPVSHDVVDQDDDAQTAGGPPAFSPLGASHRPPAVRRPVASVPDDAVTDAIRVATGSFSLRDAAPVATLGSATDAHERADDADPDEDVDAGEDEIEQPPMPEPDDETPTAELPLRD